MPSQALKYVRRYEHRSGSVSLLLIAAIAGAAWIGGIAHVNTVIPVVSSLALVAVFFGGYAQLVVATAAAFCATLVFGYGLDSAFVTVIATLLSSLGAITIRTLHFDPLFRRRKDIIIISAVSLFVSVATAVSAELNEALSGAAQLAPVVLLIEMFAVQLALIPFLMRWLAKPGFRRTYSEYMEIAAAFAVLIGLCLATSLQSDRALYAIPGAYVILIPLFWIALRLRPRYVTLASVIITCFVFFGFNLIGGTPADSFNFYLFICATSAGFLLISAQEEERRVYKNRTQIEFSSLENIVLQMESESKAKNDFIAVLSHELRNPLAPIISSIELLQLNPYIQAHESQTLELMSERVNVIKRLMDDLLDVSRINEGKITIREECCDVLTSIDRAILSTDHYRVELHQSLRYRRPTETVHVMGDPIRLEQIFSNLLANASKYSDSGDEISIEVTTEDLWITVRIQDEGVGIDPSLLQWIFEPFSQVQLGERTRKGLGIGLSLVRKLSELHGGSVWVESAGVDRGSTFFVRLPRSKECETCAVVPATTPGKSA